jgi:hypothetical protein
MLDRTLPVLRAALVLYLGQASPAQELLWERTGAAAVQQISIASDKLGDLDGDGCEDLVELQYVPVPPFCPQETHLEFISGRDGSVLRRRRGGDRNDLPFIAVAGAGDVDGDGGVDYAVTIFDRAASLFVIEVRSAVDDRLLWTHSSPRSLGRGATLLGDLDLDGDSRSDLLAGSPGAAIPSYVALSSQGQVLYELPTSLSVGTWYFCCEARSSDRMGDIDGDGCDDFIAGLGTTTPATAGGVVLVSGRTGSTLRIGFGELGDALGYCVVSLGDIDGDGISDFASGNGGDFFVPRGVVRAFSGRTGARLHSWIDPRRVQYFGECLAGGLDADQDGINDLLISSSEEIIQMRAGVVRCFSGRDAGLLFEMSGLGGCGEYDMVGLGTQPGHPFPVFAVSNKCWLPVFSGCPSSYGRAQLYRTSPQGVVPLGDACSGVLSAPPRLGLADRSSAGLRVWLSGAPSSAPAGLFLGLSATAIGSVPLPYALDLHGFPGCWLYTSSEFAFTRLTGAAGLQQGVAFLDLPEPYLASAVPGLSIHGQWIVLDPASGPGAASNALSWTYR